MYCSYFPTPLLDNSEAFKVKGGLLVLTSIFGGYNICSTSLRLIYFVANLFSELFITVWPLLLLLVQ